MKLKLFFALIFLTSVQAFSQNNKAAITGTVYLPDGSTAESVIVHLKTTTISASTDANGKFSLMAEPGNYTLVVSFIGYKSVEQKIILKPEGTQLQKITIEEEDMQLKEVQLTGKSALERAREQTYNITAIDARKLHNTTTDLNQVLNRTTGIRVRENGGMGSNFTFSLNGFSGDQVKFFLDGLPIDNYGSSFTLNNIPVNLAERIEVYKGVVPVDLGTDALGGAVNIITNKNINRFVDASYSFGSFNTHRASVNARFVSANGFVTNVNAFTNYSDNSYKVDVRIPDPDSGIYGPTRKYKRFHDGYKQGTIIAEVGVKNKKYADYLLVGIMATANKKEIQQGATMQQVVGDAFTDSKGFIPTLKYKKTGLFSDRLTATITASYNIAQNRSIDTSSAYYNWAGQRFERNFESDRGEINLEKIFYVYDETSLQTSSTFKYDLDSTQNFVLNHSHFGYKRKDEDKYEEIDKTGESSLRKNIIGLSYNISAFSQKLSFTLFGKMYDLQTKLGLIDGTSTENSFNDWGYGTAAGYFITPELQAKVSFEHAFRLQTAEEMLGNGLASNPANPDLIPESSDNINAGLAFKRSLGKKHTIDLQGSFIYRKTENLIKPVLVGATSSQSQNQDNTRVTGVDGVILYNYAGWLTFEVNATYQKFINTSRFLTDHENIPNYLYGKQLPNVPIFYGNADLGFIFRNVKYERDNLAINFTSSYSDAYFLNYPALGDPSTKKEIVEQLVHNASVAYSMQDGKYNIALEVRNFTDTKVYDFFNVQKPGRSFSVKLRYFFM